MLSRCRSSCAKFATPRPVLRKARGQTCTTSRRLLDTSFTSRRTASMHANLYGWNEVTNPAPEGPWRDQVSVAWPYFKDAEGWLRGLDVQALRTDFEQKGFAVVENIVPADALDVYRSIHDRILSGEIDATSHRHDLGGHKEQVQAGKENVGQVQWPSDLVARGRDGPLHQRAFVVCRQLMGIDTAFDFDMLIYKEAHTATPTPWHQDEAYWPSGMQDKRAITVWCALDDATLENGAMWFQRGSHKMPLLSHRTAAVGSHILMTDETSEASEGVQCVPLRAGSAVLWHGRTCHYSRGNKTDNNRRTFIVNFRPESMVAWERQNGFDHLRKGFDDYDTVLKASGDVYRTSSTSYGTIRSAM